MKRFLIPIVVLIMFALSSCVSTSQYKALEDKVTKLERQIKLRGLEGAGASFYPARGIDGDAAGDLDHIDGAGLVDNDVAFVVKQNDTSFGDVLMVYVLDADSAETEAIPFIVSPQSNAGNKRWILVGSGSAPEVVAAGAKALSTAEARSGYVLQTAAGIVSLPKASTVGYGTMVCVVVRDDNEACTVNPDDADIILLAGSPLSAGDSIINTVDADDGAGNFVCLVASSAVVSAGTDGWFILGYSGTWTDNN